MNVLTKTQERLLILMQVPKQRMKNITFERNTNLCELLGIYELEKAICGDENLVKNLDFYEHWRALCG